MTTEKENVTLINASSGIGSWSWCTDARFLVAQAIGVSSDPNPSHFLDDEVPGIVKPCLWAVMTTK